MKWNNNIVNDKQKSITWWIYRTNNFKLSPPQSSVSGSLKQTALYIDLIYECELVRKRQFVYLQKSGFWDTQRPHSFCVVVFVVVALLLLLLWLLLFLVHFIMQRVDSVSTWLLRCPRSPASKNTLALYLHLFTAFRLLQLLVRSFLAPVGIIPSDITVFVCLFSVTQDTQQSTWTLFILLLERRKF